MPPPFDTIGGYGPAAIGVVQVSDGLNTSNLVTVAQFHNADNQQPGATAFGILTGGVAQLLNAAGNLDRQRETGADGTPSIGIASGAASFAMRFKTNSAGNLAAGVRTYTPAAMLGTLGGVPWSIMVGSVLVVDSGANQETVVVTAVTATTFTALFAFAHNGSTTPWVIAGNVYNQERDAAGENDGATGQGTAVAAEYEFNGGAPGSSNYDRARSIQAKGRTVATISAGGTLGSTSFTVSSAGTLQPGMQVIAYVNAQYPTAGQWEALYVDGTYVAGSTTVPLATATTNNVTYDRLAYDAFAALGPGLNGFQMTGVGIEEEALFDPVTGLFYIERAATQDAMPATNIVAESPALWNGVTMDRARAAPGTVGVEAVSSDGVKATFRYGSLGNTPAATPTDLLTIAGSASKTIRVKSIKLNGIATANGNMPVALIRRSTLDTTGTLTNPTPVKQDNTNDPAATATLALYTANPGALGTVLGTNGIIADARLFLTTTATGSPVPTVFDFCTRQDKAIILRGAADNLAINLQGAAVPAGGLVDIEVEWEEDNS